MVVDILGAAKETLYLRFSGGSSALKKSRREGFDRCR